MKPGCAITLVVFAGLVIYGKGVLKDEVPSKEELKESIQKVKDFRSSFSGAGEIKELANAKGSISSEDKEKLDRYREFLNQQGIQMKMESPVMKKLTGIFSKDKTGKKEAEGTFGIYEKYLKFSKSHIKWGNYYIFIAILFAVAGIGLSKTGSYSIAAMSGKFVFFVGRFLLFAAAAATIIFWVLINKSLWLDAGFNLFLGPLELIAGAIIVLKVYDPNYPVLNKIVFSMILPIISSIVVGAV